jgi:hypothetical protein
MHLLGGTCIVFAKHLEQLNCHIWLALKKRAAKRIQMVCVVGIPDRAMEEEVSHAIKVFPTIIFRFQPFSAIRIETHETQVPQSGFECRGPTVGLIVRIGSDRQQVLQHSLAT